MKAVASFGEAVQMTTDRELIRELSREALVELAPEEVGTFNAATKLFFRDPEQALKPSRGSDHVLGFGVPEEIIPLLTPVALVVSTVVATYANAVMQGMAQKQGEDLATWLTSLLRSLRKADETKGTTGLIALTADQLRELHALVRDVARAMGVPEAFAVRLADVVIRGVLERGRGA
jgi:hypothetical protein